MIFFSLSLFHKWKQIQSRSGYNRSFVFPILFFSLSTFFSFFLIYAFYSLIFIFHSLPYRVKDNRKQDSPRMLTQQGSKLHVIHIVISTLRAMLACCRNGVRGKNEWFGRSRKQVMDATFANLAVDEA